MAKQTVKGPYKVINIGVNGDHYEVVETISEEGDYTELRPRKTYLKRQSAYSKMARLNRHWQKDHELDEPVEEADVLSMEEEDEAYYEQY